MADDIGKLPCGDETLREHLGYALDLIAMSLKEISQPGHADERREWYRRMSIIEVFWSQTRVLVEFFTGALASSTTAAAEHFTKPGVTYEFPKAQKLKDMRNDQIAHMNYARTTDENFKLQAHDMYITAGAINRAVKVFETNLKDDARKIWETRKTGRQEILPDLIYMSGNASACTSGPDIVQSPPNQIYTTLGPTGPTRIEGYTHPGPPTGSRDPRK